SKEDDHDDDPNVSAHHLQESVAMGDGLDALLKFSFALAHVRSPKVWAPAAYRMIVSWESSFRVRVFTIRPFLTTQTRSQRLRISSSSEETRMTPRPCAASSSTVE